MFIHILICLINWCYLRILLLALYTKCGLKTKWPPISSRITDLTLNCIRYPALPLVHKGGKPLSHRNLLIIFTPYICTLITTIFQEKNKIFVLIQNGGQITTFHFASFRFRPKFEKTLSQRNFSMKFVSN